MDASARLYVDRKSTCAKVQVMAVYRLSAQVLKRSDGRNAVRAAAYRAAEKLHDSHSARNFNYSSKKDVVYAGILAPTNAPAWAYDRQRLWSEVEAAERRKDSQVAREIQLALPVELSTEQRIELAREFVDEHLVAQGVVADLCIHEDNPDNPHAHILLTTRSIDEDGFGKKLRPASQWFEKKDELLKWREGWAELQNRALERAGVLDRVDHRSNAERGIELEPQTKRYEISDRIAEHEERARRNGEKILEDPTIALDAVSRNRAVFTRADVGRWLNTHTADAEQFQACLSACMASDELVQVDERERFGKSETLFTTRTNLEAEQRLLRLSAQMHAAEGFQVPSYAVRQAEQSRSLSKEQSAALRHVCGAGAVAVVEGRAGAGKSYMLGAAREAWEASGRRVFGGALTGKAAEGLESSAEIPSRSLAAWEYAWGQGRDLLGAGDVLVIDEAGMVGSRQLDRVFARVHEARAKVVLVGDPRQLQAIQAGSPMRKLSTLLGSLSLSENRRQQVAWHRDAAQAFADNEMERGLALFEEHKVLRGHSTKKRAGERLVLAWWRDRQKHPKQSALILASLKDDVRSLNEQARALKRVAGQLGRDHRVLTKDGERMFARGDRVTFKRNERQIGVSNGTLGEVLRISGSAMVVRLDDGKKVALSTKEYRHLDHAYAVTVHKAQGISMDRVYVLADPMLDRHSGYVALTRHKRYCELRYGRDEFARSEDLAKALKRERPKEMAVDYKKAEKSNVVLETRLEAIERAQKAYEAAKKERRGARQAGKSVKSFEQRVDAQRRELVEAAKTWLKEEGLTVLKRKELERGVERDGRTRGRGMGFER